jgi:hypothetical protein
MFIVVTSNMKEEVGVTNNMIIINSFTLSVRKVFKLRMIG